MRYEKPSESEASRTAAVRRRVGAPRPAPAGSSTITAPRAPPSRPRRPAPAARRPLPRAGDDEVRAPSPKECAWESARVHAQQPCPGCGFASTLRLPGTRQPPTLRSTFLAPRLQSQCLSNSPAGISHVRLDCQPRSLLPKHRPPPPRPPQHPPRRLAPDQEDWPPGSPRAARDLPPPGVSSPPSFACAPPAPPPSAFHAAASRANAKETTSAGQPGDWKG
nr:unnamed protein product [Rangifer tarandus platyrhynchus]